MVHPNLKGYGEIWFVEQDRYLMNSSKKCFRSGQRWKERKKGKGNGECFGILRILEMLSNPGPRVVNSFIQSVSFWLLPSLRSCLSRWLRATLPCVLFLHCAMQDDPPSSKISFFFPWWKKNQKNQDLDLFAKKWKFLQRKSPNLRGSEVLASNKDYCRASDKGDFYTIII